MCAASVILDYFYDKWRNPPYQFREANVFEWPDDYYKQDIMVPPQEEIEEFQKLYSSLKDYDEKSGQPDCELEEKKNKIKKLASELGIQINI